MPPAKKPPNITISTKSSCPSMSEAPARRRSKRKPSSPPSVAAKIQPSPKLMIKAAAPHRHPHPASVHIHHHHHQHQQQLEQPLIGEHDEPDGHLRVVPSQDLTERYMILRQLGQGTFGKVLECWDRDTSSRVAVKVIKAIPKYRNAARMEIRVLTALAKADPHNKNHCIHLLDVFEVHNHVCMVFELLSISVFDFLKQNNYRSFPARHIQHMARQILQSLEFLHTNLNIIHTDLKPENILLVSNQFQEVPIDSNGNPIMKRPRRKTAKIDFKRILLNPDVRLIDFGSAIFHAQHHPLLVSTRHYRAPEVVLGLPWSYACDIWSVGCLLTEFLCGNALFQTHDNLEHLAIMQRVLGRVPSNLAKVSYIKTSNAVAAMSAVDGTTNTTATNSTPEVFFRRQLTVDQSAFEYVLAYPPPTASQESLEYVNSMASLADIIMKPQHSLKALDVNVNADDHDHNGKGKRDMRNEFLEEFYGLICACLKWDPVERISATQALKLPFFDLDLSQDI